MADPAITRFRAIVGVAYERLTERRQEVNDLNVFPVADGDTGDNMALTMRAVLDELARLDDASGGAADRDEIVDAVAHAAMMGARGNSGVILSQIVKGMTEQLASRPGRLIDPALVNAALSGGAREARQAIPEPAPGTMLTAIEEMSNAVADRIAHWDRAPLGEDAGDAEQNALLADLVGTALHAGEEAVRRSPTQLRQLAEAGVVDAGAHGLVIIVSGLVEGLIGTAEGLPEIPHYEAARVERVHEQASQYRYCTNFAINGEGLEAREWIERLEQLGDSVLVVGDRTALKVHVHTDEPDRAFELFEGVGEVEVQEVADMHEQITERGRRLHRAGYDGRTGIVAVAAGEGMIRLFESEPSVVVVDGGRTLNPSTEEILAGIAAHEAPEVVVLPNSSNVVMAAERAAELAEKPAVVVRCTDQQAALAVLFDLDPAEDAAANGEALDSAVSAVRTGAVAPAARDDSDGRFARGDAVGFIGEEIVSWGGAGTTLNEVVERLCEGAELLTLIAGEEAPIPLAEIALPPDGVELEAHDGGQPSYWWLLVAQ